MDQIVFTELNILQEKEKLQSKVKPWFKKIKEHTEQIPNDFKD